MLERIVHGLHERGDLPHAGLEHYVCVFNNRANVNLVLFDRETERRLLFLKVSDLRDFAGVFATMQRVESAVRGLQPEPVCTFAVDRYQVLATKAYRLDLLAARPPLDPGQCRRLVDLVMDKLIELQRKTIDGEVALDAGYRREVLDPMVESFLAQWSDDELSRDLDRYLEALVGEGPMRLPRIPQHGDLGAFNVTLVDGDPERLFFIDWDSYGDTALAGVDAVTFLNSVAGLYTENGLYGSSFLSEGLARAAARYCEGVGLEPGALARLYPLCWLHYAAVKLDIGVRAGQEVAYREIKRFLKRRERFILV